MNRHILYFTQRVASAAASALVYMVADKINGRTSRSYYNYNRQRKQRPSYRQKPYYSANTQTKRPYVQKERPYQSMQEQFRLKK